jgi:hypothetical protein
MNSKAESSSRSDSVSSQERQHEPRPKALGVSPLHTYCLRNIHKQHRPQTTHKPWKYYQTPALGIGIQVTNSDKNGFIQGQKLEHNGLKVMRLQDQNVFPECQGVNRLWVDEEMYPQYGDLKSGMFRTNKPTRPTVLQERRSELLAKGCQGIQSP